MEPDPELTEVQWQIVSDWARTSVRPGTPSILDDPERLLAKLAALAPRRDHSIAWSHDECDHAEDSCTPVGLISCHAVDEGQQMCRWVCRIEKNDPRPYACEEGWALCREPKAHLPGAEALAPFIAGAVMDENGEDLHADLGVPHCTNGHRLVVSACNALDWLNQDNPTETYRTAEGDLVYPPDFHDGPIDIEWDEGVGYWWRYPAVP